MAICVFFIRPVALALLWSLVGAQFASAQAPPATAERLEVKNFKTESEQFPARIEQAARAADKDRRLKKLTHQQRKELVEFVAANLLFALVHEVGHALVAEMGLPVLGREEDAADAYAVLTMLGSGSDFAERVLVQAAKS